MAIWDKPDQEEFKEMRRRRHERMRQWKKEDEERRAAKAKAKRIGPFVGPREIKPMSTFDENWQPEKPAAKTENPVSN